MILDGMEQLRALDVVRRKALDNDVTPDGAQEDDALCIAQAKKIAEWGIEICSEHLPKREGSVDLMGGVLSKRECPKCWQELLKKIEL